MIAKSTTANKLVLFGFLVDSPEKGGCHPVSSQDPQKKETKHLGSGRASSRHEEANLRW